MISAEKIFSNAICNAYATEQALFFFISIPQKLN